jgi:hypothetical protein
MTKPKCTIEELKKHYGVTNVSETPEFKVWGTMKQRCNNPKAGYFHCYGGRGITVCPEWNHRRGFKQFIADMGPRPSKQYSLDRIDNSGPYSPDNCEWATLTHQARHTRKNHLLTIRGETKPKCEWLEMAGIGRNTFDGRLADGWNPERALFTPSGRYSDITEAEVSRVLELHKKGLSNRQIANMLNRSKRSVWLIIHYGTTHIKALTSPAPR